MLKVKNKKAVNLIANRSMKARKGKNGIAILAIMLTTILFTALFTIEAGMKKTAEESTMRMVGGRSHASYKYLTKEEYGKLKDDKKIAGISYSILISSLENDALLKTPTEIRYCEDLSAKWGFSYPTTGKMPEKEDEIATSTVVLKALDIPAEIGKAVPVSFYAGGKLIEKNFVLSGFWEGDSINPAQMAFVSKAYTDTIITIPTVPWADLDSWDSLQSEGRIMADIMFHSSRNIEKQVDALTVRSGLDPSRMETGINWAYSSAVTDPATAAMAVLILFIIMVSGYLIIYNIFYINVYSDIRFYGLLKTIGTTGRQLKRIVRRQAFSLCIIGIPAGLLIGWLAGVKLAPLAVSTQTVTEGVSAFSANPVIFIGSALFSLLTVYISCIKPCRMAARVSPVEALRFNEARGGRNKNHFIKKKSYSKKTKTVSPATMAWSNIRRNRKKVAVVVGSLSLCLILLNSVYTVISGFDMEKYLKSSIVSDFNVTSASLMNVYSMKSDYQGVTSEFMEEAEKKEEIRETGRIYMENNYVLHHMSGEKFEKIERDIIDNPEYASWFTNAEEALSYYRKEKGIAFLTYGMDEMALSKLKVLEGSLDIQKFMSGNYILVNRFRYEEIGGGNTESKEGYSFYRPGDKVTVEFRKETYSDKADSVKEYEVMAVIDIPYAAGPKSYGLLDISLVLPEAEYLKQYGSRNPMRFLIEAKEGEVASLEQWLFDYTENVNPEMGFESRGKYEKEFRNLVSTIAIIGGLLVVILAVIGILNFINAMATSMIARKQEFAMLEAVGMTGQQLKSMLWWEGCYYAGLTLFITMTAGIFAAWFFVKTVAGQIWFFTWHFTVIPVIACIPFLFLAVILIPLLNYRSVCRESIVERIQKER